MRRFTLMVFWASFAFGQDKAPDQAQGKAQDQAMLDADRAFVQAAVKGYAPALMKLLDTDFTWTDFEGKTRTAMQIMRDPPTLEIAGQADAQIKSYAYGELGDVQANKGRAHALRVWAKRGGAWKLIVYQEVMSLNAPPTVTPSAGKDCQNPCKSIVFTPKTDTERQVTAAYSKLETAAMAHNSAAFSVMVGDEFVAVSSHSNKIASKRERMDDFDHSKMGGVAPTPLLSARMFDFGGAVLMVSEHKPDAGKPLHVTRVWVKRNGNWVSTLSYQTAVKVP
jgi:hypothetical protein